MRTETLAAECGKWKAVVTIHDQPRDDFGYQVRHFKMNVRIVTEKGNVSNEDMVEDGWAKSYDVEELREYCALRSSNMDDVFDPRSINS